jgi:DNA-binding IclR family transcriptional regulator
LPVSGTQSIERAANIMRVIASRNRAGVRLVDIASQTRLERPTAHRILRRLIAEGLVMQDERTRLYFLGHLAFELGLAAASRFDLRQQCRPALARLAAMTGDTVFLTLRSGFDTLCIDRVEGPFPIKALVLDVGTRRPLGVGAGGLALLMPLRDEVVREILAANARRLEAYGGLTVPAVLGMLERARRLDFALNDAHITPDAISVGLALPSRHGDPRVAMSIGAIASRMSEPRQRELAALIRSELDSLAAVVDEFTRP